MGGDVVTLMILLCHLVEHDGMPRRLTLILGHIVLACPTPQAQLFDHVQIGRNAASHTINPTNVDSLPGSEWWNRPGYATVAVYSLSAQ